MEFASQNKLFTLLFTLSFITIGLCYAHGIMVESRILEVGEELFRESLPLQGGSRFYRLEGLKPNMWYEVKISYPASIPACFSLQLRKGGLDSVMKTNRRLLNTEKLIFRTESVELTENQAKMSILVSVEAEGIVAMANVKERQTIIFNIVCDELLLGIPHKAWMVVILVLLCLLVACMIPSFLPPFLLRKSSNTQDECHQDDSKDS